MPCGFFAAVTPPVAPLAGAGGGVWGGGAVVAQVDDRDVARQGVVDVGARAGGVDRDALRLLGRVDPARRAVGGVGEVDVAGRVGVDGVAQRPVGGDVDLHEQIARGRDHV